MQDQPNHYRILGIPPSATLEDVKDAYRKRALRTHPDIAGCGKESDFRSVQEAYEVLSDPLRRARYDESLLFLNAQATSDRHKEQSTRSRSARRRPGHQLEIILTQDEARWGLKLHIPLHVRTDCRHCHGLGIVFIGFCPRCGGRGSFVRRYDLPVEIPPGVRDGDAFFLGVPAASGNRDKIGCVIRVRKSDIA